MTKPHVTPRRAALEQPYATEHRESAQRREPQPRDLPGYLAWFRRAWEDEPDPLRLTTRELDGLGAPQWSDPFRRYIHAACIVNDGAERSHPCMTDGHGYYAYPMHCALWKLSHGSGGHDPRPLTARWLFRLGMNGGNIVGATAGTVPGDMMDAYALGALTILWRVYAAFPGRRVAVA